VIDLIVSCQQIGDDRYSYAGADVPRQAVETLQGCGKLRWGRREWLPSKLIF
jgi:hypothetical protein